jgi:Xaa-Pro aminopeptidase
MQGFTYTPKSEIDARIRGLQLALGQAGMTGAMVVHHTNLFYYTGTSQNGFLFVPRSGAPLLMIRKSLERARRESPIEDIVPLGSIRQIPELIRRAGAEVGGELGFELDVIPYNTAQFYKKIVDPATVVDASGLMRSQRCIKSPFEIERLSRACAVLDGTFERVPEMLREGMSEIELASLFEARLRAGGFGGNVKMRSFNQDFFMGTLVTGASGAAVTYFDGPVGGQGLTAANNPHGAGWKPIGRGEIIFIDYCCVVDGYTADESRMFAMGPLPQILVRAHEAALEIQRDIIAMAKPGVKAGAVYECALSRAEKQGLAEHFMGMGEGRVRFVGHGVGLELDELPVFAGGVEMPLSPGMTFAIEPKFVFPEGAVGIENTFVMEADGIRPLTRAPQEIVQMKETP